MPLIRPSLRQVIERTRADIASLLPGLDPTIPSSFIGSIVTAVAIRINAANFLISQAIREAFPQTATGANLERFAEGISRNAASGSSGNVVLFGTALSVVPLETAFTSTSGQVYRTQATVTLANQIATVSALSSTGGVATAVSAGHGLASGQDATIAGADDAEYNGTFIVTVVDVNTFTYPIAGTPNSPTSGTITATFTGALAAVESEGVGIDANLTSGSKLTLSSPISGVDSTALVRFDGVTGGADLEDDDSLRQRILEVRSAIAANFSPDTIILEAREVPGVTRVSVRRATPAAGDVTVHFVRDGDSNIIPSSVDVQNVRDRLLLILPGTSEESSLVVSAPTPVTQDFAFSSITPNSEEMKAAITASLEAFFADEVEIGQTITTEIYRAAIAQTLTDSEVLTAFTISSPAGDITINADEIAILGDVTFP